MSELLAAETLTLRDYQHWQRHLVFEAFKEHYQRVCLAGPAGSGKRFIAVWLAQFCQQHGKRMLFLTNRRILVEQMFDEAKRFGVDHGIIMANTDSRNVNAMVQIASLQTLESRYLGPGMGAQAGVELPPWDLLCIDEAHVDVDRYLSLQKWRPQAKTLLLTATPIGPDGKSLVHKYADIIVEGVKNSDLIARGELLHTHVIAPSGPDIKGVKITKGEFNQDQLGRKVQECTLFGDVFLEWAPFADRRFVCFVPGVEYGRDIVKQFARHLGMDKVFLISAETPTTERQRIFNLVRTNQAKGLVSCEVLSTGFDMPEISLTIDLQPNKQFRNWWQKISRGKRAHPGQVDHVLIDMAGNTWEFIDPDEDPIWPTGDETTQDVIRKRREAGEPSPITCPNPACKTAYTPTFAPPTCPKCGHVIRGTPMKPVRMGNGKLRHIPYQEKKKRQKSDAEKRLSKWQTMLFRALRSNLTLGQCQGIYHAETGDYPQHSWPGVCDRHHANWKRTVAEIMDARTIATGCGMAARRIREQESQ